MFGLLDDVGGVGPPKPDVNTIETIATGNAAGVALAQALAADHAAEAQRPPSDAGGRDDDDDDEQDEDDRQPLGATGTGIRSRVKASLGAGGVGGLLGGGGGATNVVYGLLGALRPAATVRANTKIGV